MYCILSICCKGLFLCIFLIARRHGKRLKEQNPQASGYELANQDELSPAAGNGNSNEDDDNVLVDEALEDEDDFEVTAGAFEEQTGAGRRLMRLRSSSGGEDEVA